MLQMEADDGFEEGGKRRRRRGDGCRAEEKKKKEGEGKARLGWLVERKIKRKKKKKG